MNELCEYICEWERKKLKYDNTVKNSVQLLTDKSLKVNNREIIKSISKVYDSYTKELREYIDNKQPLKELYETYEDNLNDMLNTFTELSKEEKINYCIKTAYRSQSIDKTLCWFLFGEQMIENLKENSGEVKKYKIEEYKEKQDGAIDFFGRYYKLIEEG